MGLLDGTFEDGTFAIHEVPDPSDVVSLDRDQSHLVCGTSNSFTIVYRSLLDLFLLSSNFSNINPNR